MGLAISVGILADLLKNDPEGAEYRESYFKDISECLTRLGFETWEEPREFTVRPRPHFYSFSYSFLHYLRRRFAYIQDGEGHREFGTREEVIDRVYDWYAEDSYHHLLYHSDCDDCYVPVDFPRVINALDDHELIEEIFGKNTAICIGSSIRLLAELREIAPYLGIEMNGDEVCDREFQRIHEESYNAGIGDESSLNIEKMVWLTLYENARLSKQYKTALVFH
ncbi:MAG: hypothetical protein AAGA60_10075 [Cyanobacteria bacterium P01_E01_bin.42]